MCMCTFGYVKEGNNCVKLEDCGCMLESGAYVKKGYIKMETSCSELCVCRGMNVYECTKTPCGEYAECAQDEDGAYYCKENGNT